MQLKTVVFLHRCLICAVPFTTLFLCLTNEPNNDVNVTDIELFEKKYLQPVIVTFIVTFGPRGVTYILYFMLGFH